VCVCVCVCASLHVIWTCVQGGLRAEDEKQLFMLRRRLEMEILEAADVSVCVCVVCVYLCVCVCARCLESHSSCEHV